MFSRKCQKEKTQSWKDVKKILAVTVPQVLFLYPAAALAGVPFTSERLSLETADLPDMKEFLVSIPVFILASEVRARERDGDWASTPAKRAKRAERAESNGSRLD